MNCDSLTKIKRSLYARKDCSVDNSTSRTACDERTVFTLEREFKPASEGKDSQKNLAEGTDAGGLAQNVCESQIDDFAYTNYRNDNLNRTRVNYRKLQRRLS